MHSFGFSKVILVLYSHLQHPNNTIIVKTHDKDAEINDACRKTQEDFYIKYFTSHFICKVSKKVTQSWRVRGSWRPNITEIFWPQSYGHQRCVFLVLHGCSTGALAFLTTTRPSPSTTILLVFALTCLCSTVLNSSAFYYLQTPTRVYGHTSTTTSDIWGPGCVTSAFFGMACVIVIERK